MSISFYDLSFSELTSFVTDWNQPEFRALQVWQGIYKQLWKSPEQFTNLPSSLRSRLMDSFQIELLTPKKTLKSNNGLTVKTLFTLPDGEAIEAVLMRYEKRNTLCISTQVGCAMGCVFCATGQIGFRRHLTSGEIIAQVMYFACELKKVGEVVTNIVVMGMGEPFHNYDNTMAAIDKLNDPNGANFGARRFTISTVGLIPAIRRFTTEKRQVNLAISLHAANDLLRSSILPVNRIYSVDELLEVCQEYSTVTGRRITFEWALIHGVNDSCEHAHLLANKIKNLLCHVNIIPLNPTKGYSGRRATRENVERFKKILDDVGVSCSIRLRRGVDIGAGCGQLVYSFY